MSTNIRTYTRVVHGSLFLDPTQPDPAKRRPDPTRPASADKKSDPTRPDPPYVYNYVLCFRNSTVKLPTGNNIQFLHNFEENSGQFLSSGLVMLPEGGKTILCSLIFQDRSRGNMQLQVCKYQMLVKCIRGLIWVGQNSEVLTIFILQGLSRPARVPDPTQCIRVQHCFNFISTGNRELVQGLYGPNRRKSLSDSYYNNDAIYNNNWKTINSNVVSEDSYQSMQEPKNNQ